jgi:copper chaperone CopZ
MSTWERWFAGGCLALGLVLVGCQGGSSHQKHEEGRPEATRESGMSESKNTAVATFAVHGMHCASCVNAIQTALGEKDGVIENKVDLAESTAVVTYDPAKVAPADLVAIIEDLGYTAAAKP